jgi:hypothetical protein
MTPRYEVLTLIGNDWENCWSDENGPETFPSREAAWAAVREFIKDCEESVARGDMSDAPTIDEFLVDEVTS